MRDAWPTIRLSEIAEQVDYGVTASAVQEELGPKFLRITDIQDGRVDWSAVPYCQCSDREAREAKLQPGDIVFARTGATTGKSFLIKSCPENAVFASYLIRVRPSAKIEPPYLAHYFQTASYWAQITKSMRGAGQPGVNSTSLRQLEIPLPPLDEQRRIAAILDKAEELRAKRRAALALLDALPTAIFHEMFGGVSNLPPVGLGRLDAPLPSGWERSKLTDVATLATGHTPDRAKPHYWNGDIPWISLTDIRELDGSVAQSTIQNVTQEGIDHSSSVRLPIGTVCFSRTASIGFVTVMGREMATSQDFVNWICGPKLDSLYLMWALLVSRPQMLALSTGSTHKTIYMRVAEGFNVLLPPIELQRRFAALIERQAEQRAMYVQAEALAAQQFQSLQALAFEEGFIRLRASDRSSTPSLVAC